MKIVLTGASRGIGRELALQLAGAGHELVLIARNAELLSKLCDEINHKAERELAHYLVADMKDLGNEKDRLLREVSLHFDYVDVVFNNAAVLVNKPFEDITIEEARAAFEVNYFAPTLLIQTLLNLLRKSTRPSVINVTSMSAYPGASKFTGLSTYGASKGALATLTEALAEEYSDEGIKFNALAFGAVQTEMLEEAFPGYKAPTTPGEMASFCKWFIEEGTLRFNGKHLPVTPSTP